MSGKSDGLRTRHKGAIKQEGPKVRQNNLKRKCRAGETAFGVSVNFACPALVEMAGALGFDWVFVDAEHGPLDVETCEDMVRAAETSDITPIIRLPFRDPRLVNKYLDTGAGGVLVPHLCSREAAEEVVAAAKYYPAGKRGAGSGTRAAYFGQRFSAPEYAKWANEETMIFGILEDQETMGNLSEILKVEGIDGVMFGPSDFSQALGHPGETEHPEVLEAMNRVTQMVLASDKLLIASLRSPATAAEDAQRLIDMGVPMLATTMTGLIAASAKKILDLKSNR